MCYEQDTSGCMMYLPSHTLHASVWLNSKKDQSTLSILMYTWNKSTETFFIYSFNTLVIHGSLCVCFSFFFSFFWSKL